MTDTLEIVRRAEVRHYEAVLNDVCAAVGLGLRTLQSRERTAETARKRAVVAWLLHIEAGWTQRRTAEALGVTTRQVERMVRNRRVMSG
jgi:hypothetical protein